MKYLAELRFGSKKPAEESNSGEMIKIAHVNLARVKPHLLLLSYFVYMLPHIEPVSF